MMATQGHPELIGIHTNMAGAVPAEIEAQVAAGAPVPSGLSAEEQQAYEQLVATYKCVAYAYFLGARPQALYGIADSPIGLAALILNPGPRALSTTDVFDAEIPGLTRDDVLDSITLYWLTNTGVSAARLYGENKLSFFGPKNVAIPVAVSVFPDELYQPPRSWAERAYPKLIHYNKLDRGGHVPAWEQPKLFTEELRAGFRSLRTQ
jgi:pimeloyl-ACP methyl ester carboxylesterase